LVGIFLFPQPARGDHGVVISTLGSGVKGFFSQGAPRKLNACKRLHMGHLTFLICFQSYFVHRFCYHNFPALGPSVFQYQKTNPICRACSGSF
jgi:hypothetical protein